MTNRTGAARTGPAIVRHTRRAAADGCVDVAILGERDLTDGILESVIRSNGYTVRVVDLDRDERPFPAPRLIISRCRHKLIRMQWIREFDKATVVAIGEHDSVDGTIILADCPQAAGRLLQLLRDRLDNDAPSVEPVHLSSREREVIVTYTLGATVRETSQRYFITENTVRSHFRRVMRRYTDAGRPVTNKSQLLIQLIADGWVNPSQIR